MAFLAVDEIQLCADPERGHVFTDRLLHARGEEETMLLGAATMRGAIAGSCPRRMFITAAAFFRSGLYRAQETDAAAAALGHRRLLGRRCVRPRRTHSQPARRRGRRHWARFPRARATRRSRCINRAMSISSSPPMPSAWASTWMSIMSAFAALEKFDGVTTRPLKAEEIGQIAGRAGRYMNDGTFGVTGEAEAARRRNRAAGRKPPLRSRCAFCNGATALSISPASTGFWRAWMRRRPRAGW